MNRNAKIFFLLDIILTFLIVITLWWGSNLQTDLAASQAKISIATTKLASNELQQQKLGHLIDRLQVRATNWWLARGNLAATFSDYRVCTRQLRQVILTDHATLKKSSRCFVRVRY